MLTPEQIIKAWKDPAYRNSLGEAERAALPRNPAGVIELSDAQLEAIDGAALRLGSQSPVTNDGACSKITKDNSTLCQITNNCTDITKGCGTYLPGKLA